MGGFVSGSKAPTHKKVSTTQIYADLIDEEKREAAEMIKLYSKADLKEENKYNLRQSRRRKESGESYKAKYQPKKR